MSKPNNQSHKSGPPPTSGAASAPPRRRRGESRRSRAAKKRRNRKKALRRKERRRDAVVAPVNGDLVLLMAQAAFFSIADRDAYHTGSLRTVKKLVQKLHRISRNCGIACGKKEEKTPPAKPEALQEIPAPTRELRWSKSGWRMRKVK